MLLLGWLVVSAPISGLVPDAPPVFSPTGATDEPVPVLSGGALPDSPRPGHSPRLRPAVVPAAEHVARTVPEPPVRWSQHPDRLVAGESITLSWDRGGLVHSVAVTASWENQRLGRLVRGSAVIAEAGAADRVTAWTVPAVDAPAVTLKLKAFGRDARLLATAEATVPWSPAVLADKPDDGIYVHLSGRPQRLYLRRDGALRMVVPCSGAAGARVAAAGDHPRAPHDHHGRFRVTSKVTSHRSSLNADWLMRMVLRYHNGHAIHATTPGYYRQLGRPASHGCVRLHYDDARRLYALCGVGTRVEIF